MKQKFQMPDGEIVEKDFPTFKTPNNHDTNFESERTALFCKDPSLTKQEFKDEADINVIIARYKQSQQLPPMALPEHFMDRTLQPTYFEMQTRIAEANANFYRLEPEIRTKHLNDPARWADQVLTALQAGDRDRLAKLGIDVPKAPRTPTPPGGTPAPGPASGAPSAPPTAPSGAAPAPATPAPGAPN